MAAGLARARIVSAGLRHKVQYLIFGLEAALDAHNETRVASRSVLATTPTLARPKGPKEMLSLTQAP